MGKQKKVGVRYLFQLSGNRQRQLLLAIICSVAAGLFQFVPYVMIYQSIAALIGGTADFQVLISYCLVAAGAVVLRFVFLAVSMACTHIGAYQTLYLVRKRICSHIGKVNLGFFTDNSSGEIKKVLMEDVERLEQFLAHQIPDITVAIAVPVAVLIYLFTVNWVMALALLVPIVFVYLLQFLMMAFAAKPMRQVPAMLGRLNSGAIQMINGIPVMKTFGLTADTFEGYTNAVDEIHTLWKSVSKKIAPLSAGCKVAIESGIFFTLPLGGWLHLQGSLSLSSLIFFVIMSIVFLASYSNLMNFAQIFQQISAGLTRIAEVMDVPEIEEGSGHLEKDGEYPIQFDDVTFSYQSQPVLQNVTLDIAAGSLTAFVGASGAGKTTAAQLIPRFWDVDQGQIAIGGRPLGQLHNENLMDLIAFVFQETFMLDDSIYENIAIGQPGCTKEQVEAAARAARIHDFIMSLPDCYDTVMGAAGIKLSGGEKQRICIARAILKDAPIIIFDEATSFTDAENEHEIQLALNQLLKGKTTIMIAHRLHTIIRADQICVFEQGQIAERGTHQQLLGRGGIYAHMWATYTHRQEVGS